VNHSFTIKTTNGAVHIAAKCCLQFSHTTLWVSQRANIIHTNKMVSMNVDNIKASKAVASEWTDMRSVTADANNR